MNISIACPSCQKTLKAPAEMAGKRARCPHCQATLTVPAPAAEPISPLADEFGLSAPDLGKSLLEDASLGSLESLSLLGDDNWARSDLSAPSLAPPAPRRQVDYIAPKLKPTAGWRFWLFSLALAPLAIMLLAPERSPVEEQDARELPAREAPRAEEEPAEPDRAETFDPEDYDLDELARLFPDNRLPGAHLARDSWRHWLYALLSGALFFGLILALFQQGQATRGHLLGVALLTATCGVMSLIMFQWFAAVGSLLQFGGVFGIFSLLFRLIGFSYAAAMDPDNGFWVSLLGFTFGVGLCEEFIKAVPILSRFRNEYAMDWRGACVWGLASGVGFGVAEGIIYSSDYYNGVAGADMYVVRFVSCVALHAVWTASVGILLWHHQEAVRGEMEWGDWALAILKIQGVVMLLHGLYDTLLKREMTGLALLTALASFGFLAWLIQWTLRTDAPTRKPGRA